MDVFVVHGDTNAICYCSNCKITHTVINYPEKLLVQVDLYVRIMFAQIVEHGRGPVGTSELRAVVVRGVRDAERRFNERRHGD